MDFRFANRSRCGLCKVVWPRRSDQRMALPFLRMHKVLPRVYTLGLSRARGGKNSACLCMTVS